MGLNARGVIAIGLKAKGVASLGMLSIGVLSLGHSDFSTTANIYVHSDYSSKLNSADAMLSGLGIAEEK